MCQKTEHRQHKNACEMTGWIYNNSRKMYGRYFRCLQIVLTILQIRSISSHANISLTFNAENLVLRQLISNIHERYRPYFGFCFWYDTNPLSLCDKLMNRITPITSCIANTKKTFSFISYFKYVHYIFLRIHVFAVIK